MDKGPRLQRLENRRNNAKNIKYNTAKEV